MTDAQRTNADEQRVRDLFERALRTGAAGGRPPGGARSTNCTAPAGSSRCTRRSGSASEDPQRRRLAADVLGQVGGSTAEAVQALLALASARRPHVIGIAIGIALGHRHDPRAIGPLRRWRAPPRRGRPLRGGTRPARPGRRGGGGDARRDVVDPDQRSSRLGDVRAGSPATTNTPAVRDALAARLYDPNHNTRADAIAGLARREDDRVVAALLTRSPATTGPATTRN